MVDIVTVITILIFSVAMGIISNLIWEEFSNTGEPFYPENF